MGARATPPPTGWAYILYINRDGTYSYWECDSAAAYLLQHGQHTIYRLPRFASSERRSLWIEFSGWNGILENNSQHIHFASRDTIETYPGSGDVFVEDALTSRYVRDLAPPPATASTRPPPPRIRSSFPSMYYVDLDSAFRSALHRGGTVRQWMDGEFPRSVRERYRYRNDQIPSALIGDFDADSVMDVALYGRMDSARTTVICLLSKGNVRATTLFEEVAEVIATPDGERQVPTIYLAILRAGEFAKARKGGRVSFSSDAVLVSHPEGYAIPYYYERGAFREGEKLVANRWKVTDPR